jgi:hypothetical protein
LPFRAIDFDITDSATDALEATEKPDSDLSSLLVRPRREVLIVPVAVSMELLPRLCSLDAFKELENVLPALLPEKSPESSAIRVSPRKFDAEG